MSVDITVVGSVNLDLVAHGPALPRPGETVTGATLARHPGGKGANQALAAQRLGATTRLVAAVGRDAFADEALALLRAAGVELHHCHEDTEQATGVALIAVASNGENQIVVASGANDTLTVDRLPTDLGAAVLCQLEIPTETLVAVAERHPTFLCLNLAPARTLPQKLLAAADLIVVNENEAAFYGTALDELPGLIATTFGPQGATLRQHGRERARVRPPAITAVDTTAAGDAFVAALAVALLDNWPNDVALRFACAAGALAATRAGAQPSLPTRSEVLAVMETQ